MSLRISLQARPLLRISSIGLLALTTSACQAPDLTLLHLDCGERFAVFLQSIRGDVANISSRPMRGVTALVTFRSEDGSVAETVRVPIDGSLDPGEASSFVASVIARPGFSRCQVMFTDRLGRPIRHVGGWFGPPDHRNHGGGSVRRARRLGPRSPAQVIAASS